MSGRRGLFLDLDGTVADSVPSLRQAYDRFLGDFGIAGSKAEFQALNGPPLPEIVRYLVERHGLPLTIDNALNLYRSLATQAQAAAPPTVGAEALLQAAQSVGWPVALVTATELVAARRWLDRTGLARYVTLVVGGDYGGPAKPAPDIYRYALATSGCDPTRSMAVEDSANGVRAACGAGLSTWLLDTGSESAASQQFGHQQFSAQATLAGRLSRLDDLIPILNAQFLRL